MKQCFPIQDRTECQKISDAFRIEFASMGQNSQQRLGLTGEIKRVGCAMKINPLDSEAVIEQKNLAAAFVDQQAVEKAVKFSKACFAGVLVEFDEFITIGNPGI